MKVKVGDMVVEGTLSEVMTFVDEQDRKKKQKEDERNRPPKGCNNGIYDEDGWCGDV